MAKENKRLIVTIILSGIASLLQYLINFFLTPYITDLVGIDAYGFVSIAKTTVSYAAIITVALTTFVVRFISADYLKKNYRKAKEYYSSSIVACVGLSVIIFFVACFVTVGLDKFLDIPGNLVGSVKVLFLLVFFNFVLTTVTTPYSSSFFIKNRLDIYNTIKIISYVIDAATLIILFKAFHPDIWFVGVGSITSAAVVLFGNMLLTKRLTPELKFDKKDFSSKRVKEITSNGIWQSVNNLGNVLNSGLDLIVSNKFLSAVQTGQIAVVKTIGSMFIILYTVISQTFQPKLLKAYISDDMDTFIHELKNTMKICGCLSNIAFAGFFVLGELYYQLWLPSQDSHLLYCLTVIAVSQSITEGYAYPIYYVYTLTLRKKVPCIMTIMSGLLNVGAMVILLTTTNIGVYVIVATTAVIMTGMNLIFNPMYSMKCLGLRSTTLFSTILRHIVSVFIMVIVFHIIAKLLSLTGWSLLIVSACIMVLCGVIIHFCVMADKQDREKLASFVKKKFH